MKDEKAKYLMIYGSDIHKQLYSMNREPDRIIDAQEIFSNNGLPEKFQKIIIKINIPFFIKNEAEEYTMGFPLDITSGKIEEENNKKYITVSNRPIFYGNQAFRDKIKFRTQLEYSNFDEVINFFLEVDSEGYLKEYLQSIKEFFDISLNLDLLFQSWNESKKDPKQALKLYKKKTLNR